MTTEKPQVSMVKASGVKEQWMHRILYKQDGRKYTLSRKALLVVGGLCVFSIIILILMQPPSENREMEQTSSIKTPEIGASQDKLQESFMFSSSKIELNDKRGEEDQGSVKDLSDHDQKTYPGIALLAPLQADGPAIGSVVEGEIIGRATDDLVRVKLLASVKKGAQEFLPEGTILLGKATQEGSKAMLTFDRASKQDGGTVEIHASGVDPDFESLIITYTITTYVNDIGISAVKIQKELEQQYKTDDEVHGYFI